MRVVFQIEGASPVTAEATCGDTLLSLLDRVGIALDAPCAGNGSCGKCRVRVLDGATDAPKTRHLTDAEYADGWRLACDTRPCGDCTVLVPETAFAYRENIKTDDPALSELSLRASGFAFENDMPRAQGDREAIGCAVDLGTTSVTAVLCGLKNGKILAKASAGNGQIRYGADVIHRMLAAEKPGGREKLRRAITDGTLKPMLDALCRQAGIESDRIIRVCIGANTTMNHLLLGADTRQIHTEPYVPAFLTRDGLTARELALPVNPQAEVILSPNVGAYVGGDITAGTLASGIWDKPELSLLIDLGTNGELVLGGRDFLLTCACSAGPAFEGGEISCGMRATDGAVEAVRIDDTTMEPTLTVIGGGTPKGICGSGLIDLVSELFRTGILDARGKFIRTGKRVRRDAYGMGSFVFAAADGRELALTEADIDNFIRAKGAIFSAIVTLLSCVDMTVSQIDRVLIAGGIGSGINIGNAVRIGMLPALAPEKFSYIGNASLAGAYAMTVSNTAAEKCRELAAQMTYLELSSYPSYMESFVAACFLPHTDRSLFPDCDRK